MSTTQIPNVKDLYNTFTRINADSKKSGESVVPLTDVEYYTAQIQNMYNVGNKTADVMAKALAKFAQSRMREAKMTENYKIPAAVEALKKYGVKFMFGSSAVSPIVSISVPVNLDDAAYERINDVLDRFNLLHLMKPIKEVSKKESLKTRFKDFKQVPFNPVNEVRSQTIWYAQVDTRHFDFEAFDYTEQGAIDTLKRTLVAHAKAYGLKGDWYFEDDINCREIILGQGYVDREEPRY